MKLTTTLCASLLTVAAVAHAGETKLTKADLTAATQIVYSAYGTKEKFPAVRKKVEGKLGPVQKSATNMLSWFAKDAENKCVQFWITENKEGLAATGMSDSTDDAKAGCK